MKDYSSNFKNLIIGSQQKLLSILKNPYKKVNLSFWDIKLLKHKVNDGLNKHSLLGHDTFFYNNQEYLHGIKEIFVEEIYLQKLDEFPYIIDCGANIGLSIIYLKSLSENAIILAFEPDKKNFELLQKNVKSHNLKNVTILNEAVWKNNSYVNFSNEATMGSKIGVEKSEKSNLIRANRLKDFLNVNVDFLKIDIEGAEYEVLKDIEPNLIFVKKLFLEYHGNFNQNHELVHILQILNKNNFEFYIKEAAAVHKFPFLESKDKKPYDVQLNIFCIKNDNSPILN